MAITIIEPISKDIIPKKQGKFKSSRLRFFLKTLFSTILLSLGAVFVLILVFGLLFYPKVKDLSTEVENTYSQAKKVETALKNKDLKQAEVELVTLKNDAKKTRVKLENLSFARYIPIAAGYYSDGQHLLNASDIVIEIGSESLTAIEPFADVLGFKGVKVELTADKKAEKIVKEVIPQLVPLVDDISVKLVSLQKEINQIKSEHYPDNFKIKGLSIKQSLNIAQDYLSKANNLIPEVKPLLLAAPEIAGEPTQKTYLILLQNDKELRPTGGFVTSYALATVVGGRLIDVTSDDIYQLDLRYNATEKAPDAISKYIGWIHLPLRDSNISPDYKVSAQKFESMYNTIRDMPKVDGVFALDTEFVRAFLEVTGPIKTKKTKETFSAQNNFLGIPDVVYKLELHAERISSGQPDRKGILGELMNALIDKVMGAKTDQLPKYINTFVKEANEKHLLFYFHNQSAQNFVETYNAAGLIKDYTGDYFHLNNANFGGLKGNIYLKQKVDQDIQISSDGSVTKSVDVTLINPVKADGWLNSIYLNWMRIYVPKDSVLISKKVQKDFTSGVEFNKEVYRGYGATYPLNSSTFNFTYKLPFKILPGQDYKMLIQKQPGVEYIHMTIKINGEKKEEFDLRTDQELTIKT